MIRTLLLIFVVVLSLSVRDFVNAQEPVELGTFNGKTWYIDRLARWQPGARFRCERAGWVVAEFDSLEEVEWVISRTLPTDLYMWTAGTNYDERTAFYWGINSGSPISPQVPFLGYDSLKEGLGLALSRSWGRLVTKPRGTELPYLCTTPAVDSSNIFEASA